MESLGPCSGVLKYAWGVLTPSDTHLRRLLCGENIQRAGFNSVMRLTSRSVHSWGKKRNRYEAPWTEPQTCAFKGLTFIQFHAWSPQWKVSYRTTKQDQSSCLGLEAWQCCFSALTGGQNQTHLPVCVSALHCFLQSFRIDQQWNIPWMKLFFWCDGRFDDRVVDDKPSWVNGWMWLLKGCEGFRADPSCVAGAIIDLRIWELIWNDKGLSRIKSRCYKGGGGT